MLHAVIMAGGFGTRFWPESRARRPKQLLKLVGPQSMLRATVDRLGDLVTPDNVLVLTNKQLEASVSAELPEIATGSIIGEPCRRDTAAAIGLAATLLVPDDLMLVMPSDHVIFPDDKFRDAVQLAVSLVEQSPQRLITFGIKPTYPAESFGYIERGEPLSRNTADVAAAFEVRKFREKPKAEVARQYLAEGGFYWNSGIFVWRAGTILAAIERHQPALAMRLAAIAQACRTVDYAATLEREFQGMPSVSIDYAVLEHAKDVVVIEAPFAWDDVGSWQSVARLGETDPQGNTTSGKHLGLHTTGSIIRTGDDHLVVTLGLSDCIIVHTPDATLVANRRDEESIRQLVKLLEERGWGEYL